MNFTVDQFMAGLEQLVNNMPRTLNTWSDLDEELKEEYAEELMWTLSQFDAVQATSGSCAVAVRLVSARLQLFALRAQIREAMAVDVELGSTLTIAGASYPSHESPPSAPTSTPPSKRSSSSASDRDGQRRSMAA